MVGDGCHDNKIERAKVAKGSVKHRSEDKEGHDDNPPTCARDCINFLR